MSSSILKPGARTRPDWKNVNEVAAIVGVHPKTVRRWIRSGRVRAYRVAGQVRIDLNDLDAVAVPIVPTERRRGGAG